VGYLRVCAVGLSYWSRSESSSSESMSGGSGSASRVGVFLGAGFSPVYAPYLFPGPRTPPVNAISASLAVANERAHNLIAC